MTAETADLLKVTRPAIQDDIASLRRLSAGLNKPKNTAAFEKFLSTSPEKITQITRTASYGSWFNFYLCRFDGTVQLPTGPVKPVVCRVRCEVLVSVPFRERNPFRSGRSACSSSP